MSEENELKMQSVPTVHSLNLNMPTMQPQQLTLNPPISLANLGFANFGNPTQNYSSNRFNDDFPIDVSSSDSASLKQQELGKITQFISNLQIQTCSSMQVKML